MRKHNGLIISAGIFISAAALILLSFSLLTQYTDDKRLIRFPALLLFAGVIILINRKNIDPEFIKCENRRDTACYIAAAAVDMLFTSVFIRDIRTGFLIKILNITLSEAKQLYIIAGLAAGIAAFPVLVYLAKLFDEYFLSGENVKNGFKNLKKPFLIMSGIYCSAIYTIIRANYAYKDDMHRLNYGNTWYERENRFLAELVTRFLENDRFYADISPVPQIIEMLLMAMAAVICFTVITERSKPRFIDYAAMVPFGLSPYFMECISFKYDSPQHGAAVLLAVLPLFYSSGDRRRYRIITALCMAGLCCFHQVPMAVFPSAVILISLLRWNRASCDNKETGRFILDSAAGYIAGMLFFRLFLMHSITYNYGLSDMLPLSGLLPGMLKNYRDFAGKIIMEYDKKWLLAVFLSTVALFLLMTSYSKRKKIAAVFLNCTGILLIFALSNSLYPLLTAPLHSARHMYSFGLNTGLIIMASVSVYEGEHRYIEAGAKAAAAGTALMFFMFSVKYGNALFYQREYTAFRTEMLVEHLSEMDIYKQNDRVPTQIIGGTGFAQPVASMKDKMINTLVTTSLNEYFGRWDASDLYSLYGINAYYREGDHPDMRLLDLPVYEDNYYFTIYSDGRYVLCDIKDRSKTAFKGE